jgi:WhiB family redox-sensing transcriptional regulator
MWEWQLFGSCRDYPSELFFHPEGERGPSRASREAAAKAICQTCPVIRQCAEHALRAREPYGVWGGMSEADRDRILGRGRGVAPQEDAGRLAQEPIQGCPA